MKPILLAIGASLAFSSVHADVDRTHPPKAGPLPTVHFPDGMKETLPNGLKVIVVESHRQPTVTYRLLIKSGEAFDGSKPGLVSLTANLLNKGTATMTADQFAKKTDFLGASVEATSNDDALAITATGLSRYRKELMQFLSDAALRPAFLQGELDKEKVKALADLAQKRNSPEDLAVRLRDKLIYGKHPYGEYATPESVKSITRDDIVKFHDVHFVPNNASLVVVGDISADEALSEIKELFGDWKKGDVPKLNQPPFPRLEGTSIDFVERPGSVQSNIIVAEPGIARNNPDGPALSVVNSVLGGGFSGRLFANLREKHAYTYGSYSSFAEKKYGGTFSATAEVRNAVTAPAAKEILNELKRITTEPIPDKELSLQRNYLAGNFLMSLESDERTAQRLQELDLYDLPADFYKTYAQKLTSVTPDTAFKLAKKYIDPNNLDIVVVGEAKDVIPQLTTMDPVNVYDTDLKYVQQDPKTEATASPSPSGSPAQPAASASPSAIATPSATASPAGKLPKPAKKHKE